MTWRLLFLTLSVCFCTSLVHAEFTLTPGVDMRVEYDDNIYLDSDNEEDDVITTVSPNLTLTWETARLDVSLFASIGMEKYLDHTDEDRIGADSTQSSSLDALARVYRELLFLRVSDSYTRVPIDEGGRGGEGNRTTNLTDSNTFEVNPYLQFELMKNTRMQLGYTYQNLWYEEEEGDDAVNHFHYANVTRELSARTTLSLSGAYDQYRPKNPDEVLRFGEGGSYDYDQKSASVGLSYQATDRLRLNGQYGHTWLEYKVRNDSDSDTWSAAADYEISSNYTTGVQYSKSYIVSVEDGPSETDYLLAYLAYDERFSLRFSLFTSSSDYVEIKQSTDSYGGELSGDLPFNDKVGVTGLLRYTNYDDSGIETSPTVIDTDNSFVIIIPGQSGLDAEEYDRYSMKFALYYETRLGRVSTGYIFNKNVSDLDSEDYINNIVYVDASLKF
ncbi:MAG: TIGR03016 family PEP-CTERM system-associated outer membrane protein [Desulfuromonadales bacterium]